MSENQMEEEEQQFTVGPCRWQITLGGQYSLPTQCANPYRNLTLVASQRGKLPSKSALVSILEPSCLARWVQSLAWNSASLGMR